MGSTQILDSPCAESQEIADGMLGTTMEINVGAGADVNACVSGMDASNVTVGQIACFEFRQPDGDAAASNTLEVTGVSLTDQFGAATLLLVLSRLAVGDTRRSVAWALRKTWLCGISRWSWTTRKRRAAAACARSTRLAPRDRTRMGLSRCSRRASLSRTRLSSIKRITFRSTVSLIGLACVLLLRLV